MSFDLNLDELEKEFKRTDNPVLVWIAIRSRNWNDTPLPSWIDDYLQDVGTKIVSSIYDISDDREAEVVGKALGFGGTKKGGNGKLTAAYKLERDRALYNEVLSALNEGGGTNLTSACHYVAAITGQSSSTVRRAYLDFLAHQDGASQAD